jgi:hypothetical protein
MSATVVCIIAVYWWKEIGDRSLGGSIADAVEDAAFVGMGAVAAYYEALIGLAAVNIAALLVMMLQIRKGR